MTREQTGRIEAAVINALWRNPMVSSELMATLDEAGVMPPNWHVHNLRIVLRRLYQRGVLSRLEAPSCTRFVMWWAS